MTTDFIMTVVVDDRLSTVTIVVAGDFDASRVEQFERRVDSLPLDLPTVDIDIRDTTILDSAALGALIRLVDRLRASGVEPRTLIARSYQAELLEITGLTEVLAALQRP